MGKTLEKVFLEKLNSMPVPEVEVQRPVKGKSKKGKAPPRTGLARSTRKTVDTQSVHTVTSSNDSVETTEFSQELSTDSSQATSNGQSVLPAAIPSNAVTIATAPVAQINNSHMQVCYLFIVFSLLCSWF